MDQIIELLTHIGEKLGAPQRHIENMQEHGKKHREPHATQVRCGNSLIIREDVAVLDLDLMILDNGDSLFWAASDFRFHTKGELRLAEHLGILRYAHGVGVTKVDHRVWRDKRLEEDHSSVSELRWVTNGSDLSLLAGPQVDFLHFCLNAISQPEG